MRLETKPTVNEDRWGEFWRRTERPAWPEYTQIRLDWLAERIGETVGLRRGSGIVVIEVGAGSGWVAMVLTPLIREGRYVCSDVSEAALLRLETLGLRNVSIVSPQGLGEWTGRADVVVCADVLEHVTDRAHFAESLRGLLVDGGRLLLTTPNRYYPIMLLRRCLGLEATGQPFDRPVSRAALVSLIHRAGFRVDGVELRDTESPPPIRARTGLRNALLQSALAILGTALGFLGVDARPAMLLSATALPGRAAGRGST